MQFIDVVNRILRMNGFIRGDTDPLTNFNNLQHGATMNIAIIAVQNAINDLLADHVLPLERISATITLVDSTIAGVRTYQLATDFAKFWQDQPFFYDSTNNNEIFAYPGGERQLQLDYFDYANTTSQHGYPNWWFWVDAAVATVAFYQNPDSTVAGRALTYDYQKNIMPMVYTDVLPFQQDSQAMAFTELASVRFDAMMKGNQNQDVRRLPSYVAAMAKTMNLINPRKAPRKYGNVYLSRLPGA